MLVLEDGADPDAVKPEAFSAADDDYALRDGDVYQRSPALGSLDLQERTTVEDTHTSE